MTRLTLRETEPEMPNVFGWEPPLSPAARRWRRIDRIAAVTLALVLLLAYWALTSCGAQYDVYGRSHDYALESLRNNVTTAVTCLKVKAPSVQAAQDKAAVAEQLTDCAGTNILNQDDDVIRSIGNGLLDYEAGTIAVTSRATDDRLELTLYTEGSAVARAGVSENRTTLGTCWQVSVDLRSGTLSNPSGSTCRDSVVTRANIQEEIALENLQLSNTDGRSRK